MGGHSKLTKRERNRVVRRGLAKHGGSLGVLMVAGEAWKPADVRAMLDEQDALLADIDAAEAHRRTLVARERAVEAKVRPFVVALRTSIQTRFGIPSPAASDFGFEPWGKPGPKTPAVKAESARKAKATRERRGTKGKRRRR